VAEVHSTDAAASSKPAKPYADFPLFPHATGRWAKKIRGKLRYFGKWDDPDAALVKYLAEKDNLHAGRTPRDAADALTVYTLCGKFLTTKKRMLDAGELSPRSFDDYTATCKRIMRAFGKGRLVSDLRADDFEKLRAARPGSGGRSASGTKSTACGSSSTTPGRMDCSTSRSFSGKGSSGRARRRCGRTGTHRGRRWSRRRKSARW